MSLLKLVRNKKSFFLIRPLPNLKSNKSYDGLQRWQQRWLFSFLQQQRVRVPRLLEHEKRRQDLSSTKRPDRDHLLSFWHATRASPMRPSRRRWAHFARYRLRSWSRRRYFCPRDVAWWLRHCLCRRQWRCNIFGKWKNFIQAKNWSKNFLRTLLIINRGLVSFSFSNFISLWEVSVNLTAFSSISSNQTLFVNWK